MKTNFKFKTQSIAFAYVLLAVVFLVGCEDYNVQIKSTETTISGRVLKTYTIYNCEYIGIVHGGSGDFLTHKGNCKFCLQRFAK
jgi:hypothetical protein